MAKLIEHFTGSTAFQILESRQGVLKVRGEFARPDVATANGRVYPMEVWRNEIDRIRPKLQQRKVIGELDHPCLTDKDWRVLTASGWKPFEDVRVGDRVWSRVDGQAVLSDVLAVVDTPYQGAAYRVQGRSIDATFTPDHKILLQKRPGRRAAHEEYVTVRELYANPGKYAHHAIPKTASWVGEAQATVRLPGVPGAQASKGKDPSQDLVIDAAAFAGFIGLYLAEGHCTPDSVDNYGVFISQKKEWSKQIIRDELLARLPDEINWSEGPAGFFASDVRLYNYLKPLGNAYTKRIPEAVKRFAPELLEELIFWFTMGDGRYAGPKSLKEDEDKSLKEQRYAEMREGGAKYTRQDVFSVSEGLIDDLHECVVKTGRCASKCRIDPDQDYEFAGRTILAENKVPLYQLHLSRSKNTWMDPRFISVDRVEHEGRIYCLTTKHGNFYMEKAGKSFWTGNSDGKLSLQKASHLITDLRIEGNLVIGEAEILENTDQGRQLAALIRHGVRVGVSSRGQGSVVSNGRGQNVVQGDFKLVTFDFVADPADMHAYPDVISEARQDIERIQAVIDGNGNRHEAFLFEGAEIVCEDGVCYPKNLAETSSLGNKAKGHDVIIGNAPTNTSGFIQEQAVSNSDLNIIKEALKAELRAEILNEMRTADVHIEAPAVSQLQERIAQLEEENSKLYKSGRNMAFRFFLENRLSGHPFEDEIKAQVGSLHKYDSVEALRESVEDAEALLQEEYDRYLVEEQDRKRSIQRLQEANNDLLEENERLKLNLSRVIELAERLDVARYAESRIGRHPNSSKIRALVEQFEPKTKEDVDAIIEQFRPQVQSREDIDRAVARVRSALGTPPSVRLEEGVQVERSQPNVSNYNGLGVDLHDIKRRMPVLS